MADRGAASPSPSPSTVLPGGRGGVCRAVMEWLGSDPGSDGSRLLLVTGPAGSGKTFTLAWAASELAVLAEAADDERFAWVSARGMTPRVLGWLLAGQLGVTVRSASELASALAVRLRGFAAGGAVIPAQGLPEGADSGGASGSGGDIGGSASRGDIGGSASRGDRDSDSAADPAKPAVPPSRSATWDLLASSAAAPLDLGRWNRVTILISELDLAGHLRDGSARAAVVEELIAPLLAVPGVRLIVESAEDDLPGAATVIDLADPQWTDRAGFAAWLDDLVPSGGAAAPQAYPNPTKAREILSLAVNRHAGLLPASDERPWKLAAVPFDVAFREGIADQIVLEPANLVLVQQPALSTAIDALGAAVSPGTRAAWRVAGQALTNAQGVPQRAAVLHGAALAVGDTALAEAVLPYTRGTRPSDGAPIGEPTRWLTRWAGWRPLPPDTPRATPWPGPIAALALTELESAAVPDPQAAAEPDPAAAPGPESAAVPEPDPEAAAASGPEPEASADPKPATDPTDPTDPETILVAIDDLARAYRLDPATGAITARPSSPVMLKARTAAVVDASPSLVLTDAGRRLAALGPGAPRSTVAAVRDILPDTAVTAVAVASDALVFGAADGRVHVWSPATDELMADPADQHSGAVTAVAAIWMPDLDVLFAVSGGQDGTFRLWAVPADASLLPVEDRGIPVTAITAARTALGPVAAVAGADGDITLWDLGEARTGKPIPLGWTAKALALGSDGLLVAAGDDGLTAVDVDLAEFFED